MADASAQSTIIQPPVPNTPDLVRVFAMPARYRHGASVSMVEPQKASVATATIVQPPVPPKVLAPLPAATKMTQPAHTKKGLLIAGVIVVIALGVGGYILLRSMQKNTAVVPEPTGTEAPVETPAATNGQAQGQPLQTQTPPATNPFPAAVTPGLDTDSDGLTDTEETIVYATNPNLPDTDADGFLDGNEVFHGYNPNGTAPGTLVLAGLALQLQIDGFQMLYPSKWTALAVQTGTGSVITTSTGESVTVTVSTKENALPLADWYQQNVTDGTPSASKSRRGYPMLIAKNQLSAYLDLGTQVVSLQYNTSTKATIDYLQTFQMMVNSVSIP